MTLYHGPSLVTDGLVLYLDAANPRSYPGSGSTWYDLTGRGNTGTLLNTPTFSANNGGNITYNGTNQSTSFTTTPITANSSFTIDLWLNWSNFNNNGYVAIVDAGEFGGGTGFSFAKNNSNQIYVASNGGYVAISNSFANGTWYNLVATYQFTSTYAFTVYVNGMSGTVANSGAGGGSMTPGTLYIGSKTGNTASWYPGSMSMVKFYNRVLSAAQLTQNFNAHRGRYGI